ncbi:MAG: N-acetylmuramoyl-L-alanine amidase [Desulfobacterales bacterium]|nr:N-acetylmuramoyl-L-alanine amidase [Desulfobacterales bacterium]
MKRKLFLYLIGFIFFTNQVFAAVSPKDIYIKAENAYSKLLKSSEKQRYRHNWIKCINLFEKSYKLDPSDKWAPAALYMTGKLWSELFKISYRESDKEQSINMLKKVIENYPKSAYKNKAEEFLGCTSQSEYVKMNSFAPQPVQDKKQNDNYAEITNIRFWSNPNYTRIVLDIDNEISYSHNTLKEDSTNQKPLRIYVDASNSKLGNSIKKVIPIDDDLLRDVRAGQYTLDIVRVVIDLKSYNTYKIFSLRSPFRIVIDVWGETQQVKQNQTINHKKNNSKLQSSDKFTPSALVQQLALGVKKIIIDPGHGGKDFGAPGFIKGVHEKNIVLKIAKKLKKQIENNLKCEVIMTRNSDEFLTLEERTAVANTKNADLFISIHTNASVDSRAYGFETYFLNIATDNDAILVAARENATSTKNISDLETILLDLLQNNKIEESARLAHLVQNSIHENMKSKFKNINNKGVKQAPFYVLLGAQMPAVLIETSFISNSLECRRLASESYQDELCNGIFEGIKDYIMLLGPSALR